MTTDKFQIPVSDWTLVGIDNAKFVLLEAQTYAQYLSDVSSRITARAFSILTVLVPITSALIAYVVGQTMKDNPNYFITYYIVLIVIGLIATMFFLGKTIMPRLFMPLGRKPIEICNDEMLGVTLSKKLSLISIVLNEIENCQQKIDFNELQNTSRNKMLNSCMKAIGILFAIAIIVIATYLSTAL